MNIPTLSLRPDIDSLLFPACLKVSVGYAFGFIRVERNTLLITIGSVVEEDAPASYTMVGPVVNGAFVVCFLADNVFAAGVVVERARRNPRELWQISVQLIIV